MRRLLGLWWSRAGLALRPIARKVHTPIPSRQIIPGARESEEPSVRAKLVPVSPDLRQEVKCSTEAQEPAARILRTIAYWAQTEALLTHTWRIMGLSK